MLISAMERINIQTDDFAIRIEAIVSQILNELRTNPKVNLDKSPLVEKLSEIIMKRLGLKVRFHTKTNIPAAILPFYPNKNHIFLHPILRGHIQIKEQDKIIKELANKRGTVNLEKATVGGFFSEYENPVYFNFKTLSSTYEMTAGEMTAVILHELGHGFNACYYADRTDECNQVLAGMIRRIREHKNADNVEYVYQEIKKIDNNVLKEDIDAMLNGPAVIAGPKFFKVALGIVESQTKFMKYNRTAFEEGSDAFASRFGRGKDLAVALQKLHMESPEVNEHNRLVINTILSGIYLIFSILVFGAVIAITSIPMASLTAIIYFGWFSYILTYGMSDGGRDMTYDRLKQRYIRIRQEQIEFLKEEGLSKQFASDVIAAIGIIDEQIKNTKDFLSLPGFIGNIIFSKDRKDIEIEKMLEMLASNDLFIHAAVLKQHS